MAKDYSKIKALASQILECIGDEPEGENPDLPAQDNDVDGAGEGKNIDFLKTSQAKEKEVGSGDSKKNKGASLAMLGSMLASKYNK